MFWLRIGLAVLAFVCVGLSHVWADDLFLPYLRGESPIVLREVPAPDLDLVAGPDVIVRRVVFASHVVEDETNGVYAIIARPVGPGPFPGILLFHGGGGIANEPEAVRWARRGYVAVAVDLPGIADPLRAIHSTGTWRYRPYGGFVWTAFPTAETSVIHQAVVAGLQGLELLRAQPSVDPTRLGVMGWSWGGYLSLMVCGLVGDRVQAGFSMYGSGFYEFTWFRFFLDWMPPAQRAAWLTSLDAGGRAPGITVPFFIAAPANDTFFHPPAVERTLAAIPSGGMHLFAPNSDHRLAVPGGTGTEAGDSLAVNWFAWHLRGFGGAFPTVEWQASPDPGVVAFRVQSSRPVLAVSVWHSRPTYPEDWPGRTWLEVTAQAKGGGRYEAEIPSSERITGAAWFALVSDDRPVTVATRMILAGEGAEAAYYYREDFNRFTPGTTVPGWQSALVAAVDPVNPALDAVAEVRLVEGRAGGALRIGTPQSATNGLRLRFQLHSREVGPDWQMKWLLLDGAGVGYGLVFSPTQVGFLQSGGVGADGFPLAGSMVSLPESARLQADSWTAMEFRWEPAGRLKCLVNDVLVAGFEAMGTTANPTFQKLEWSVSGTGAVSLDGLGVGPVAPPPLPPTTFRLVTIGPPHHAESTDATSVMFGFEGVPGRRYRLESSIDLASDGWISLGELEAASDGRFEVRLSRPGDVAATWPGALFFRVEMTNP